MEISQETEIRSLDASITQRLANFFDGDDSILGLLMGNIAKKFDDPNSELRFTSKDIDSVRNHALQLRRSPILILLDEWGTMGRNRPRVHHLHSLLVKCQLFRAADYIARLINEPSANRPATGPAARVDISLPDDIESAVNGMSYPFSVEDANQDKLNFKPKMNVPIMNFEATSDSKVNNVSIPFIKPPSMNFGGVLKSDLIKFSERSVSTAQPKVPTTLPNTTRQISSPPSELPQSIQIPMTVNSEAPITAISEELPAFSRLILSENSHNNNSSGLLPVMLNSINSKVSSNGISNSSSQTFHETSSDSSDLSDTDESEQISNNR